MLMQPYEYTNTNEMHTLKRFILWHRNYIYIFFFTKAPATFHVNLIPYSDSLLEII